MPINKNRNVLIQITLTKDTAERLKNIVADLSRHLNIELNKSQTIAILINDYKQNNKITNGSSDSKPKRINKSALNYQNQINALKDKLNVSYTHLAEILDIPTSTLKKYAYGKQQPQADNEQKILNALKRYGIK